MSRKEKMDFYLSKLISRKLTVFIIASIGLFIGKLTSSDWVIVATVYIAVEAATNIVERIKRTN
tara:strand:+ start:161 stop:352 length:192 start_codon:yes stop_codon:yes gene_type:complete